jgi:hypothetical protein
MGTLAVQPRLAVFENSPASLQAILKLGVQALYFFGGIS